MFRLRLLALVLGPATSAIAQNSYLFTPIDCPGSNDTRAFGVNESNVIVGGCRTVGLHGFVYNDGVFDTVEPPGSSNSRIRGISGSNLAGFYRRPEFDFFRGFARIDGEFRDIVHPLAVQDTLALAINSSRQIVGGYVGADANEHGFLYDAGEYYPLDCPGFINTQVNGIDDYGRVVGFCDDGVTTVAGIYDGTVLTLFQCPGAADTAATAINSNGVVVGWYDTPATTHGFITVDMGQSCTQIDYPDAPNTQVMGITASGSLVGFYFDDALSYIRSFLATPK